MYIYIHIDIYLPTHTRTCTHARTHTHKHTHTRIHTSKLQEMRGLVLCAHRHFSDVPGCEGYEESLAEPNTWK